MEQDLFIYLVDIVYGCDVGVQGFGGLYGEGGDDVFGKYGGYGDK